MIRAFNKHWTVNPAKIKYRHYIRAYDITVSDYRKLRRLIRAVREAVKYDDSIGQAHTLNLRAIIKEIDND